MKTKPQPCKPIGNANKGNFQGCAKTVLNRKYGLCMACYRDWLLTTDEGQEQIAKTTKTFQGKGLGIQIKKAQKEKREGRIKLLTVQNYVKKAQKVFNTWIRQRDKDNPCISCRNSLKEKFDAGHFWNANNHWNVRFDERNVHGQCVKCNQHLHGNLLEYRKQLEFYYGERWLTELEQEARKTRKFTIEELKEIIEKYKIIKK